MERVHLHLAEQPVVRLKRWRTGRLNGWDEAFVTQGRIGDLWFGQHTKLGAAYVDPDEQAIRALVEGWLAVGAWERHPAVFDSNGQPTDGAAWIRSGQRWLPAEP